MWDKLKFVFMAVYALGVTTASFIYFFRVSFDPIPKDNVGNVNLILGFLIGSAVSAFIGYYFGSSQSQSATVKKELPPVNLLDPTWPKAKLPSDYDPETDYAKGTVVADKMGVWYVAIKKSRGIPLSDAEYWTQV